MSDPLSAYVAARGVRTLRRLAVPLAVVVVGLVGLVLVMLLDTGADAEVVAIDDYDSAQPCEVPTGPGGPVEPTGAVLAAMAARAAGFVGDDLVVAVAVAGAESNWVPDAVGGPNPNGSYDYGLWQINDVHEDLLAEGDWADPYYNAQMAFTIFSEARGWAPWTTWRSGAYEAHLPAAEAAVAGVGDFACDVGVPGGPVIQDLYDRTVIIADAIAAGEPEPFYGNTDYWRMCARLAANIHGHGPTAGYPSAIAQWNHYVLQGVAHPGDTEAPPGSVLFYATQPYGHVATALGDVDGDGDADVASNDVGDAASGLHGGVYIVDWTDLTAGTWSLPYLGWAPPIY